LYYVTFIYDFSRKTQIYFMKTKDEVLNRFQEFKARENNLMGKKSRVLRTNIGREYTSINFNDFCKETGIKRDLTVSYNPQKNDVAVIKKRPTWLRDIFHDPKGHAAPSGTFRERK